MTPELYFSFTNNIRPSGNYLIQQTAAKKLTAVNRYEVEIILLKPEEIKLRVFIRENFNVKTYVYTLSKEEARLKTP